jgi:hypothetical protein
VLRWVFVLTPGKFGDLPQGVARIDGRINESPDLPIDLATAQGGL